MSHILPKNLQIYYLFEEMYVPTIPFGYIKIYANHTTFQLKFILNRICLSLSKYLSRILGIYKNTLIIQFHNKTHPHIFTSQGFVIRYPHAKLQTLWHFSPIKTWAWYGNSNFIIHFQFWAHRYLILFENEEKSLISLLILWYVS